MDGGGGDSIGKNLTPKFYTIWLPALKGRGPETRKLREYVSVLTKGVEAKIDGTLPPKPPPTSGKRLVPLH